MFFHCKSVNSRAMSERGEGYMVCEPVLFYDLVIPNFFKSKSPKCSFWGPDFATQGKTFFIVWMQNTSVQRGTVNAKVWLGKRSQGTIFLDHLSLSLVGDDGNEMAIGSKTNVSISDTYVDKFSTPDANFQKDSLPPNFLPDGELRIRSRIRIRSLMNQPATSFQDNLLVDDLCLQFAEEALSFTDSVLVCGEKKIPVHRFMLATRSPVFKALFSHEETSEGQDNQVNNIAMSLRISIQVKKYFLSTPSCISIS
jgi:hypothetical protein